MNQGASINDYDWWLLATAFAICGIGVLEIWSATHASHLAGMHTHQMYWIALGVILMFLFSRVDYHTIMEQAPLLYLIAMVALVAVLAMGHTRFGAKRWLPILGGFLQVSELVKLIIIVVMARFFAEVRTEHLGLVDIFKAAAVVGLPLALIMLQPDLGTALVLVPLAAVGAYLAGLQWKHAAVVLALAAVMLPVGYHFLKPYQKERVTTFLRPEEDPRGAGYQILQSKIAVGSGGFWGKGLGNGSQNQLGFVPVRYSDFILAALAEELGFSGVFVALLLYMFLLLRLGHAVRLFSIGARDERPHPAFRQLSLLHCFPASAALCIKPAARWKEILMGRLASHALRKIHMVDFPGDPAARDGALLYAPSRIAAMPSEEFSCRRSL